MIRTRLIIECHQKSQNVTVWFHASSVQPSVDLSPVFLLRHSLIGVIWMWRASLSGPSPGRLALSTTVAIWWSGEPSRHVLHPSWCSFSLVLSLPLGITNVGLATAAGILYTTLDCFSTGKGSFTSDTTEWSDRSNNYGILIRVDC